MVLPIGLIRKPPPPNAPLCILSPAQVRQLHTFDDFRLGAAYVQTAWWCGFPDPAKRRKENLAQEPIELWVFKVPLDDLLPDWGVTSWTDPDIVARPRGYNSDIDLIQEGRRVRAVLPPREPHALRADSPLEEAFVRRVLTPATLPSVISHTQPQYEVPCGARKHRVDYALLGTSHKIAIELDGYAYHSDRKAFTADRVRQNELALAGFLILRFTYEMVQGDPGRCVAQLQAAMRLDPVLRGYVDSAPRREAPQNGGRSC